MVDDKTESLFVEENKVFVLNWIIDIGSRSEQQDSIAFSIKENEGCVVICDGMGGLKNGSIASNYATQTIKSMYESGEFEDNLPESMINAMKSIDKSLTEMTGEDSEPLKAGSTCVMLLIKEDSLYWCSVGDSRAYILRGNEFVQMTQDQNYKTVLDEQLRAKIINETEYEKEIGHGEALISYLGMGNLYLVDYNDHPLRLMSKDKIILMSDGLYRQMSNSEIQEILGNNERDEIPNKLFSLAKQNSKSKLKPMDNLSIAVLEIK